MILKDKIQINRSPDIVWNYLRSPAQMKEWDPKIKAVVPVSSGEPADGYRYRVRCKINGEDSNFLAEFMEYQEPSKLLVHFTGGNLPAKGYVQEIYALTEKARGTLLEYRLEVHNAGRNIFSAWFALFIHYSFVIFSKKKHLRKLKDLVETV